MTNKYDEASRIFKALCDENRLMVLELLQHGEKYAGSLLEELKITQSTLSHHMRILCESGIVVARRLGKWTYYSLSREGCENAKYLLAAFITGSEQEEVSA